MTGTVAETCPWLVSPTDDWAASHLCAKPVKRDGLCGIHALAKERRAGRVERVDRLAEKRAAVVAADHRVTRFVERFRFFGIRVTRISHGSHDVRLTEDEAEKVLSALRSAHGGAS